MGESPFARASGVLLHVTSLPGPYGLGDLGPDAYRFIDRLADSKQSFWQILPLVPSCAGDSPYAASSAFAGNPLLIPPAKLVEEGLLDHDDLAGSVRFPSQKVDFQAARNFRFPLLRRAFERFQGAQLQFKEAAFKPFCHDNAFWLEDYALFMALKDAHKGAPWWNWGRNLLSRQAPALARARSRLAGEIEYQRFLQFCFFSAWAALKRHANERSVRIVGDIPIFVAHDSSDVWAHQDLFALDDRGKPTVIAGVPPDLFAPTGQRWGNPHYRWDVLAGTGYRWWIDRLRETLRQVDVVRIDHFRGFEAYWEIPADLPTAERGRWVEGPGEALFRAIESALGQRLPIIVEDLGMITPEVIALRERLGYPGMRVLQFAFGGDDINPHRPENYIQNCVVYTATHDNDTTVGWFASLSEKERRSVREYLGTDGSDIAWDLIRLAMRSIADIAIVPLQDVLSLGSEARMNFPGKAEGNWVWRCDPGQLTTLHLNRLGEMTEATGRAAR